LGLSQISDDIMHLAGRLPHRSAQSEQERKAGLYIEARLGQYSPNVTTETFNAPESYPMLFASYLAEFAFVGLIAMIWPAAAFGYGLGVFLLYLFEFCGYRGLSRFLPHYPSQNIVARFMGTRPRCLIIVTAHYDSGTATPLSQPERIRWLRPLHLSLMGSMALVIATCAVSAFAAPETIASILALYLRWGAIIVLLAGALGLYISATNGEDIRGANNNASGAAALLGLAEKLAANPIEDADIWIAATGSHEAWMAGLRNLLADRSLKKKQTWLLNLESVGNGTLHYLRSEGFMHALPADQTLVGIAEKLSVGRPVRAGILRAIPTAAHIPLMRGMKAMTLMGLDRDGLPAYWNQIADRISVVDETGIAETIAFSELIVRELAASQAEPRRT
jgi:hypothetical protein